MKHVKEVVCMSILTAIAVGCSTQPENVLLRKWDTPFETAPFDEIRDDHFMPALIHAMNEEMAQVEAVANNKAQPTFENTIEALEKSGKLLDRVSGVFSCLNGANTNDQLQSISKEIAPLR